MKNPNDRPYPDNAYRPGETCQTCDVPHERCGHVRPETWQCQECGGDKDMPPGHPAGCDC